jgi:hypothetical protein
MMAEGLVLWESDEHAVVRRKLHHVHWFLYELKPVYMINSCALYHECLVWILLSLYLYYSSPDYFSILIHIFQNAEGEQEMLG